MMNEDIEKIFKGKITIDDKDIPIVFMDYTGNSDDYVVYYNDGATPVHNCDDEPIYSRCEIEFNVYTKGNYLSIVQEIKNKLKENGYSWLNDDGDLYEKDTKYHHFVSTFEKIRRI